MNFAHGFPFWCVSVALEHAGRLVVGVVHNPLTGETYSASLGRGATLNGRPIRVSAADRLAVSLIATGLPTDFDADADRQTAYMRRFSTGTHSVRRTGSSALNLAILAAGGCEVCYAHGHAPLGRRRRGRPRPRGRGHRHADQRRPVRPLRPGDPRHQRPGPRGGGQGVRGGVAVGAEWSAGVCRLGKRFVAGEEFSW